MNRTEINENLYPTVRRRKKKQLFSLNFMFDWNRTKVTNKHNFLENEVLLLLCKCIWINNYSATQLKFYFFSLEKYGCVTCSHIKAIQHICICNEKFSSVYEVSLWWNNAVSFWDRKLHTQLIREYLLHYEKA